VQLDVSAGEDQLDLLAPTPDPTAAPRTGWEHRVLRVSVAIESAIVGLLAAGIFAVVLGQSFSRYFFDRPLTWGGEVAQLGLIWITFIGAVLVMAKDRHVTVRIFGRALGLGGRRVLAIVSQLIVAAACVIFVVAGYDTTMDRMEIELPATGWPAGLQLIPSLAGFALMGFHALLNLWITMRYGYVDHDNEV
jgi:TRAP-type transport system small permease protein